MSAGGASNTVSEAARNAATSVVCSATIERIFVDYDDRVHIGVTVNDDPGQQLMRETGRYLFFFAGEVEPA